MSEEYQVIARKYRPMRFSDVVGQEVVTRTLMNAIKQNRTAHAYLFVGPRGVGKTTLARIFAKALNCENPQNGEPCCECQSCVSIAAENNLDVIEIDAASRNSVEDMRNLTEEAMHMPISSKYKIYIIDEIHMLSNQAWNALLKTVEEPPKHIKFIFATTEVHKVLATIISRCQRFDLMPITTKLIAERLKFIANDQGVEIDDDAIFGLARAAEGGMRDAQSLLDQIISFFAVGDKSHRITSEEVMSLFGLADKKELYDILEAVLVNDVAKMVNLIHYFVTKGKNLETLFDDILTAIRGIQLTIILNDEVSDILEETPDVLAKYKELSKLSNLEKIQILMETLMPSARMLRDSLNKQVFIETILLKAMREANSMKISDLINRLSQLKNSGELEYLNTIPTSATLEKKEPVEDKKKTDNVIEVKPIIIEDIENNPNYKELPEVDILHDMGKVSVPYEKVVEDFSNIEDKTMVESPVVKAETPKISEEEIEKKAPTRRKSIFDNHQNIDKIMSNSHVKTIIDLLGGEITDIHIDQNK